MIALLLAACLTVEGERVRVTDLARAAPEFRAAPADEAIAFAPGPGARRVFTARELMRLASRFRIAYTAASAICFERASEPLARERVEAAIRAAAGQDVELLDFSRSRVPAGELEFTNGRGDIWSGRVRYGANRSVPIWAKVRRTYDVDRGDTVTVEAESGLARVSISARAETAGNSGETILVRRTDNGCRFRARVTAKGKASIDANRRPAAGAGARRGG